MAALPDFAFAAPGPPLYDVPVAARMRVPPDAPEDAAAWEEPMGDQACADRIARQGDHPTEAIG